MQNPQNRASCFARLLDVRTYVFAAREGMARADVGGALFMIAVFSLIALVLAPIYLSMDLLSTWDFTTGLRNVSEDAIYDVSSQAAGFLNLSVGALLTGIIFTGFTLLPSLFELAFPTVNHPLLNLVLLISIIFDFITDWGKSAEVAASWSDNPTIAFLYTIVVCAFVSVGIQAILVCCATVVICGVLRLLSGGVRQAQAVVIEQ